MADNHHIVPWKTYVINACCLLVLMILTVLVWRYDIGKAQGLSLAIAMGIAITKAALIVLFFMNVKYSSQLTWVFAGAGFLWLMILFGFTLVDHLSQPLGSPFVLPLPGAQ